MEYPQKGRNRYSPIFQLCFKNSASLENERITLKKNRAKQKKRKKTQEKQRITK